MHEVNEVIDKDDRVSTPHMPLHFVCTLSFQVSLACVLQFLAHQAIAKTITMSSTTSAASMIRAPWSIALLH